MRRVLEIRVVLEDHDSAEWIEEVANDKVLAALRELFSVLSVETKVTA